MAEIKMNVKSAHDIIRVTVIAAIAMLLSSCGGAPSYVIPADTMSHVIADLYVAESVTELNSQQYHTDSTRQVLKQSVFARYGITPEQFDTSMAWYGHNMDKMVKIYDKSTDILTERRNELTNTIAAENEQGDSANIWYGARYLIMDDRYPSSFVKFVAYNDGTWNDGDQFTWRAKLLDEGVRNLRWNILAQYEDGSLEWINQISSGRNWNDVTFASDTTKRLMTLKGTMEIHADDRIDNPRSSVIWIDSISLARKEINHGTYSMQRSRIQKHPGY